MRYDAFIVERSMVHFGAALFHVVYLRFQWKSVHDLQVIAMVVDLLSDQIFFARDTVYILDAGPDHRLRARAYAYRRAHVCNTIMNPRCRWVSSAP